ncbi:hypothetical protein [Pseudoblastomonas halimionae]|uniref:Uncharacterized protein n=1 Tax=Alteriqipengyuania halimionae TaxID=1926630 RepID=A0A6I4U429_9SPHN|nr:hypothetical protein [Alteriqipengyuania halimionae]MXP10760.1 hypothetical protein [Alteriqipengyuania halimionae]
MSNTRRKADESEADNRLQVERSPDETAARATARKLLQPTLTNAIAASAVKQRMIGDGIELPGIGDYVHALQEAAGRASDGDLAMASRMLASQAITLDGLFTELARRAAMNLGEYMDSSERYGRLSLRAQSNCRTTLEALAKLHQPREQTVRHVHVNEGGQAVVAETFHNYSGGHENAETVKQSHATEAAGDGTAMLGADPQRDGVSIASGKGQAAMQDARRD